MLFNSYSFLIFLPLTFILYWVLRDYLRLQNALVVFASYIFYGWWDWRFLLLIAFTSGWSYVVGLLELSGYDNVSLCTWKQSRGSKVLLTISLLVNLGILGYFKYYNFFVDQAIELLNLLGFHPHLASLKVILPVGISFYTFQALSYTVDVYSRKILPTRDPIAFFAFISFFPQLVAGPIERATNLLPQFLNPRKFDYPLAVEGCQQMLWGFFKKIVVADSCAFAANSMLNHAQASSITLWMGMLCFSFQIYGDFSGYSDIAIGCSKLFGVKLMRNFAYPYFSRDIAEFWRRWHISLTTWFRDYLYIPLGGSRCGIWKKVRNTFIIFFVSGFWHGANWTFIAWGVFHAMCFLPLLTSGKNRKYAADIVAEDRLLPSFVELRSIVLTFFLAVVGWTFFRAPTMSEAFLWLGKMFSFSDLNIAKNNASTILRALPPILALVVIEWTNRKYEIPRLPRGRIARWVIYLVVFWVVCWWRSPLQVFIYFQF